MDMPETSLGWVLGYQNVRFGDFLELDPRLGYSCAHVPADLTLKGLQLSVATFLYRE